MATENNETDLRILTRNEAQRTWLWKTMQGAKQSQECYLMLKTNNAGDNGCLGRVLRKGLIGIKGRLALYFKPLVKLNFF